MTNAGSTPESSPASAADGQLSDLAARLEGIVGELEMLGLSLAAALAQNALDVIRPGDNA